MREQTKWVMLLTATAFVALMVFEWGMDLSGRSSAQASGGEIGRVNGESITYEDYLTVYRNLYQEQQAGREDPISPAENRAIEEAAWDQLIMDELIEQEVRRRGIRVTEEEIRQAARFAPPPEFAEAELFQTDGQFDLAKYHQFLASPAVDTRLLVELEDYYRRLIPRRKLMEQVLAGVYLTDGELWRMWRDRNEQVRVRYLAIDPAAVVPEGAVSVSDREVAAYYEAHEDEFARPARAEVRYVVLGRAPTAADTAAARERAAGIRARLLAGEDFAEVARAESADPGSAEQGGRLGTFQRGQMVPAFDQAVWSQPVGEVGEPVLTPFGFHIIQVERREGDEAEARHILIPIERSPEAEDALLERVDSLEAIAETGSLEEAAEALGLRIRSATISEEQAFLPGVGAAEDAADWAFNEAAPGETSPAFETEQAYYMVQVAELIPAGTLPLEEAEPTIRAKLLADKRLERARQVAREIVDEIRAGRTLAEVAATRGLEVRETESFTRSDFVPGLGRANPAIGAAFGLRPGQVSGAVEADGAFFILESIERIEADRETFEQQKEIQRLQLTGALQQERWSRFVASLREQAEIMDFRDQVLVPAGSSPAAP